MTQSLGAAPRRGTILVVDDEPAVRRVVELLLRRARSPTSSSPATAKLQSPRSTPGSRPT